MVEQDIDDLLHFVEGLRSQWKQVSALKADYEQEDRMNNYTPPWKRAVGDRTGMASKASPISIETRFAPELTAHEMQQTYEGLPEGWFHICVAARMLSMNSVELRRRFFWMSRNKYIMYSNATQLFRKRVGVERGNFAATSKLSGPFASKPKRSRAPKFL